MSSSDSESEESDSEWTQEDKALMVSNPRKFFKTNYSKFNNSKYKKLKELWRKFELQKEGRRREREEE